MSDDKRFECPYCGAMQDSWAAFCSECDEPLALTGAWQRRIGQALSPVDTVLEALLFRESGRRLYVWWAVIGTLGLAIGDLLVGYLVGELTSDRYSWRGADETWFCFFCIFAIPVIPLLGTGLGIALGLPIHRTLRRRLGHYVAIGLTSVCIAIITMVLGSAVVAISLMTIH